MSSSDRTALRAWQRWCWRVARTGLTLAACLALLGGFVAAAADRNTSNQIVVAAFFIAIGSVAMAWLSLPAAVAPNQPPPNRNPTSSSSRAELS